MTAITITLPDGSQRELEEGATVADLALDIGKGLAKAAIIAEVDGVEVDLVTPLADGSQVSIITSETDQGLDCLLYTSPSPRDTLLSRMPSSA